MGSDAFRFADFELDPAERQLRRGGARVELNGRYFDALVLLVRERGKLIPKERFLDEVWRGVPVTDEALTQCIRTLRRQLGDEVSMPRFIETVPKHGYRFIAEVASGATAPPPSAPHRKSRRPDVLHLAARGTAGGALAGLLGGLFYGFAASASNLGSASALLVLLFVTVIVATLGAAAVSLGIALAGNGRPIAIAGGAAGGFLIGAIVKLIGMDAFNLLLGKAPANVTGAGEGALLGAVVGAAAWLATVQPIVRSRQRGIAVAASAGSIAGLLISFAGGQMLGGSLDLLTGAFPGARLQLDSLGALFGEARFGPVARAVTAALEGALFGGCVVGAMLLRPTDGKKSGR